MITALLVLLFGGIGAVARFVADGLVERRSLGQFPLGTLAVNAGGCFVLGLLVGLGVSHRLRLLLDTTAIGSYTTFSTWMLETHRPLEDGDARLAWLNIACGVAAGFGAVLVGRVLGAA